MKRIVLAASLSLFPAALSAQTCMGGASFADRRAQIGADASFSTGGRSSSGSVSIGSDGPFATVGFGRSHDDDIDDDATVFAATAGLGFPLRPRPKMQLCPFISAVVLNGREFSGYRISSHAFGFGASVGTILSSMPGFEVVPFANAALITQTTTTRFPTASLTTAQNITGYGVSVGAGFVFAKAVTIRPSTTYAVAEGRTTTSYGLLFSIGFGTVARRARVDEGSGSLATVWLNTRGNVYYCQGSRWFGATAYGSLMTEREALATGARPEHGRRC